MNLIDAFNARASVLSNIHYDDASARLAGFLDWLEGEPITKTIVDQLRQRVNVDSLLQSNHAPKARTLEEIAAIGLRLIEMCRTVDFFNAARTLGIQPPFQTSALQDYCADAMPRYINPFIDYVGRSLGSEASRHSVAGLSEGWLNSLLVSEEFQRDFPSTHAQLEKISREFLRPTNDVAWQNIANSCRQTLLDFCAEVRGLYDLELTPETKDGDVKTILRTAAERLGQTGQFGDSLTKLIGGVWSHTQSLLHRGTTSRAEAIRLYLWTGLLIKELSDLLQTELST